MKGIQLKNYTKMYSELGSYPSIYMHASACAQLFALEI